MECAFFCIAVFFTVDMIPNLFFHSLSSNVPHNQIDHMDRIFIYSSEPINKRLLVKDCSFFMTMLYSNFLCMCHNVPSM